ETVLQATKTTAPKPATKAPVKDLPVKTAQDVKGGVRRSGCDDEFGCGTNHNETLLQATKTTAPKQGTKALVKDLPVKTAQDVKGGVRGGCDEFGCGTNHNETLLQAAKTAAPRPGTKAPVKDLPVKTAQDVKCGVRGGCDDFGCGTNHNET